MRKRIRKLLVAGGAGFIGSAFVRLVRSRGYTISIIDKLTYAGDLRRLAGILRQCHFYRKDICRQAEVERIFSREKPDVVVNFAAESHVDRSILEAGKFLATNVGGTQSLIDAARKYGVERFIQISTDEVYGDIAYGTFAESSPLRPSSPYAAAKAGADLLIQASRRTFGLPAIIVRPSNNYGPWQYPEKLIPLSISRILTKKSVPVYGRGENIREWLYVDDCAKAVYAVIKRGRIGETYNVGSGQEMRNIQVVRRLLYMLNAPGSLIRFVGDRLGHDLRYRLDSRKITAHTGWKPGVTFETGLENTVNWCVANRKWLLSKWRRIAPLYA